MHTFQSCFQFLLFQAFSRNYCYVIRQLAVLVSKIMQLYWKQHDSRKTIKKIKINYSLGI